jgi:hypothetical protein
LKLERIVSPGEGGSDEEGAVSREKMVGILREADRVPVAKVSKKHGVSVMTC